jgi:hypothetical protein
LRVSNGRRQLARTVANRCRRHPVDAIGLERGRQAIELRLQRGFGLAHRIERGPCRRGHFLGGAAQLAVQYGNLLIEPAHGGVVGQEPHR